MFDKNGRFVGTDEFGVLVGLQAKDSCGDVQYTAHHMGLGDALEFAQRIVDAVKAQVAKLPQLEKPVPAPLRYCGDGLPIPLQVTYTQQRATQNPPLPAHVEMCVSYETEPFFPHAFGKQRGGTCKVCHLPLRSNTQYLRQVVALPRPPVTPTQLAAPVTPLACTHERTHERTQSFPCRRTSWCDLDEGHSGRCASMGD